MGSCCLAGQADVGNNSKTPIFMQDGIDSSCIKMGAILSIFLMLFPPFPAVSEPTLSGSIPRLPLLFVCQAGTISPALAGRSPPIQAGEGAVLMYCPPHLPAVSLSCVQQWGLFKDVLPPHLPAVSLCCPHGIYKIADGFGRVFPNGSFPCHHHAGGPFGNCTEDI